MGQTIFGKAYREKVSNLEVATCHWILLDETSLRTAAPNQIDHFTDDNSLLELGRGVGILGQYVRHNLTETLISNVIEASSSTSTDDVVLRQNVIIWELPHVVSCLAFREPFDFPLMLRLIMRVTLVVVGEGKAGTGRWHKAAIRTECERVLHARHRLALSVQKQIHLDALWTTNNSAIAAPRCSLVVWPMAKTTMKNKLQISVVRCRFVANLLVRSWRQNPPRVVGLLVPSDHRRLFWYNFLLLNISGNNWKLLSIQLAVSFDIEWEQL